MSDRRIEKLTDPGYGLSPAAAIALVEAADARGGYESLPQASKDAMQAIADMFSVRLSFAEYRGKLHFYGIENDMRASMLVSPVLPWVDETYDYWRKVSKGRKLDLLPGAGHVLTEPC